MPNHSQSDLLGKVPKVVIEEMITFLTKPFSNDEIKQALNSMGDLKAPGPNGMSALFYKRFWELVGEKVQNEVLQVLNGAPMPAEWNETIIVLIPKTRNPERKTRESLLGCKNPLELLEALAQLEDESELKALTLMWEWWDARNKVNAGENRRYAEEVCCRVERHMTDFQNLQKPEKKAKPPDTHRWRKPLDDFVKVNFDGVFDSATGKGAWGFIIRDHTGGFATAGAGISYHLRDALHSETEACIAAVEGAIKLGANRVIFESGSTILVNALNGNEYDRSEIGVLIKDAKSLCTTNFECSSFSFDRRACNAVAHELDKFGANSAEASYFWVDHAPNCVIDFIASDVAV
ncbi:hypothetical protein ACQ4PT_056506 [Festuca glaucescens]